MKRMQLRLDEDDWNIIQEPGSSINIVPPSVFGLSTAKTLFAFFTAINIVFFGYLIYIVYTNL